MRAARHGDRRGVGKHRGHPHEKAVVHACSACSQRSVQTQVQGLAYTRKPHDGDPHTRQVERGDLLHECLAGPARRLQETHTQTGVTTIGLFRYAGSQQSTGKTSIITITISVTIATATTTVRITAIIIFIIAGGIIKRSPTAAASCEQCSV